MSTATTSPSLKRAAVIRHLAFEDLGTFHDILIRHGFQVEYYDAGVHNVKEIAIQNPNLLIVLGGPISAYADKDYPSIRDTVEVMKQRIKQHAPILGICLGAQLLAHAFGASVYTGSKKEIGWSALELTRDGRRSPLKHLRGVQVLHWHGDIIGAERPGTILASTEVCENQAFAVGTRHLGLQFHLELDPHKFEQWLIGHALEIATTPQINVQSLRAATLLHSEALKAAGDKVLTQWLGRLPGVTSRVIAPKQIKQSRDLLFDCVTHAPLDFARSRLSPASFAYNRSAELQSTFDNAAHFQREVVRSLPAGDREKLDRLVTAAAVLNKNFYDETTDDFVTFFRNEKHAFGIKDIPQTPATFIFNRHPELREHYPTSHNYAKLMTERMTAEQKAQIDALHQQALDLFPHYGVRQPNNLIVTRGQIIAAYQEHLAQGKCPTVALGSAFGEHGIRPTRENSLLAALGPIYRRIRSEFGWKILQAANRVIDAKAAQKLAAVEAANQRPEPRRATDRSDEPTI